MFYTTLISPMWTSASTHLTWAACSTTSFPCKLNASFIFSLPCELHALLTSSFICELHASLIYPFPCELHALLTSYFLCELHASFIYSLPCELHIPGYSYLPWELHPLLIFFLPCELSLSLISSSFDWSFWSQSYLEKRKSHEDTYCVI